MNPLEAWSYVQKHGNKVIQVESPSAVIQSAFNHAVKSQVDILKDAGKIENLARRTHLTVKDTTMWLNHLHMIRLRRQGGAKKGAAKRAAKAAAKRAANAS